MSLNEVLLFVTSATEQEARAVCDAAIERIKFHNRIECLKLAESLHCGDKVAWKTEKHGFPVMKTGKVVKVNTTTAKVKADDGQIWSISLSLLQVRKED